MKKIALLVALFATTYALACLNISGRNIDGGEPIIDGIEFFAKFNIPEEYSKSYIAEEKAKIQEELDALPGDWGEWKEYELYCDMGAWMIYDGDYQGAIDYMHENVIEEYRKYSYYSNLGVAHELNGNLDSALYWTKLAVEANENAHWRSEWIHIKILEAQIALEKDPEWLNSNTILGWEISKDSIPLGIPKKHDPYDISDEIVYQLHERTYWVKPENKVVGELLLVLADNYSKYWDTRRSLPTYELAKEYDPDLEPIIEKRMAYLHGLLEKDLGISNERKPHDHDHESSINNGDDFELSTEIKDGPIQKSFQPTEKEWSTIIFISSIIALVILSAAIIIWRYRRKN